MEVIVFCLALYGGYVLWRGFKSGGLLNIHVPFATNRGLLAVKAAWYLLLLDGGSTEEEANEATDCMDVNMPTEIIIAAQEFIKLRYNGKQLPMISDARNRGFSG